MHSSTRTTFAGIAFVTAQAYINGVIADVRVLRGKNSSKDKLLKTANPIVADTKLSRMQLCDTMANYYKHRDGWPSNWVEAKGLDKGTVKLLQIAGFSHTDRHLCTTVASLFFGNVEVKSLVPLVKMLTSWRQAVIKTAKS